MKKNILILGIITWVSSSQLGADATVTVVNETPDPIQVNFTAANCPNMRCTSYSLSNKDEYTYTFVKPPFGFSWLPKIQVIDNAGKKYIAKELQDGRTYTFSETSADFESD